MHGVVIFVSLAITAKHANKGDTIDRGEVLSIDLQAALGGKLSAGTSQREISAVGYRTRWRDKNRVFCFFVCALNFLQRRRRRVG
jgi:hypothetical protein